MEDPVLSSRLDALRTSLELVRDNLDSKTWQSHVPPQPEATGGSPHRLRSDLLGDPLLWGDLELTLRVQIERRIGALKDWQQQIAAARPDDDTTLSAAWTNYRRILHESEGLLRECLEILGTLAMRHKDVDRRSLDIAEQLILDCVGISSNKREYHLLIPCLTDAITQARARVIRLRFPEWTIWDLPLLAHDAGRVAIRVTKTSERDNSPEDRELTRFLSNQADALLQQDPQLKQMVQPDGTGAAQAQECALKRAEVLLADAYAALAIGPAYGFSAIRLRLSPTASGVDVPPDTYRAEILLCMLEWMSKDSGGQYADSVGRLREEWNATLARLGPVPPLDQVPVNYLRQYAASFVNIYQEFFRRQLKYPFETVDVGWKRALEWSNGWRKQIDAGEPLTVPGNYRVENLRDVLNATWHCRVYAQSETHGNNAALARVGKDLAAAIIDSTGGQGSIPLPSVASRGGRP